MKKIPTIISIILENRFQQRINGELPTQNEGKFFKLFEFFGVIEKGVEKVAEKGIEKALGFQRSAALP